MVKKLEFVKKRDKRIVPFDKKKISEAIFKAAQSVGGQDRYLAEDLAEVVRMYLANEYEKETPSVEDIQDIVERVLIKTGHARTAKAYILYRQQRARIRKMREGLKPEDMGPIESERRNLIRNINISVRESSDNISLWDKERIIDALVRETGLSRNISELIVGEVEEEVVTSKIGTLSSSLVRELVNAKLVTYGLEEERNRHARLGVPSHDVKSLLEEADALPDVLSVKLGRHIKKEYALLNVIPDRAVEKHLAGEIRIHNLENIDKFYSAVVNIEKPFPEGLPSFESLRPYVEGCIVLNMPSGESYRDGPLNPHEIQSLSMEPGISFIERHAGRPVILRVEDKFAISRLPGLKGRIKGMDVYAGGESDRAVLNKVTLNNPGDTGGGPDLPSPGKKIREFMGACSEIKRLQESFMEKIYAGRQLPVFFREAEKSLDIDISNFLLLGERSMAGILDEIFSHCPYSTLQVDLNRHHESYIQLGLKAIKTLVENGFKVRIHCV